MKIGRWEERKREEERIGRREGGAKEEGRKGGKEEGRDGGTQEEKRDS